MDSVRFILAVILMIAVVVVTNLIFSPAPPEPVQSAGEAGDTTGAPAPVVAPSTPSLAPLGVGAAQAAGAAVEADTVFVESPLYRFGFSTAGASVVSTQLLRFESFAEADAVDAQPVQLVQPGLGPLVRYRLDAAGRSVSFDNLAFTVIDGSDQVSAADTLRFVHADPQTGVTIELNYAFSADSYLVDVWGSVRPAPSTPTTLGIQLGPTLRINERRPADDQNALAYVVNSRADGIRSVRLDDVEAENIEEGPLAWVAIKNKYFLAAALSVFEEPARQFGGAIIGTVPEEHAASVTATLPLGSEGDFAFQLYLGPQEYDHLTAVGRNLEDVNPYGWRVFRPIIRPLARLVTWALVGMHRTLGLEYGWVLILFGILIRVVMWPLNARAMRAQLKNMELQPRMREIQEKYRKDPEQLQREMLRLYKEEGFNPLGGCLPILIPFPVLITLFFVFQSTIEFRGVEFLWFPDLSQPDPYYVLPLLLGASIFLMQWVSMRTTPDANPQLKLMLWFMPAMLTVIFLNLAAGLNLYYLSMNVASIPQQVQLVRERRRMQGRLGAAATTSASPAKSRASARESGSGAEAAGRRRGEERAPRNRRRER